MRVALLGNSGSGKSSLARALASLTGASVLDLDGVAWEPDGDVVRRPLEAARADVRAFCARSEHWVVEGCYASLIEATLAFRPKLLLLNPGLDACLANCRARPWEPHKFGSAEQQQANLAPLLAWVADYEHRDGELSLQGHRQCLDGYTGSKRELRALPVLAPIDPELLEWLR